jgi:hypothetical protein
MEVEKAWRPHERHCIYTFLRFWTYRATWRGMKMVRQARNYDILHVNHEGLIWYALACRKAPVVCHVRTVWPRNGWGKLFRLVVLMLSDAVICITEQEQKQLPIVKVIYNVAFKRGIK